MLKIWDKYVHFSQELYIMHIIMYILCIRKRLLYVTLQDAFKYVFIMKCKVGKKNRSIGKEEQVFKITNDNI